MNMNDVLKFFGFEDNNFDNYIIDYRLNYQKYNKEVAPHYSNHFEDPHLLRYVTTELLLNIFNNLEYLMYCEENRKYSCKSKQVSIFVDTESRFMVVTRKLENSHKQTEVTQAFRVIHKNEWIEWKGYRLLGDYSEAVPPLELGEGVPIEVKNKEELLQMTKNDLKSGMRVVVNQLDSYYQYIVLKEAGILVCTGKTNKGYPVAVDSEPLCDYTDDLVNKHNSNLTIMRIYDGSKLIWERTNKDKPFKLTPGLKVEVQDMNGWLPAILIEYDSKQSSPFQVLLTKEINDSNNNKVDIAKYKYCRLASNQKALLTEEQAREEFKTKCSMTENCKGCNPNKHGRGCCDAFIKDRIQIIE